MKNDGLPSIINENTLVSKLSFLERGADEVEDISVSKHKMVGAGRLREALLEHCEHIKIRRGYVPKAKRVDAWFLGEPISGAELGFFYTFYSSRYDDKYENFEPHQKKVYKQIGRFFRFYEGKFTGRDKFDLGDVTPKLKPERSKSEVKSTTRLLDVQIVLTGIVDHLDDTRTQIEADRPNSPEAIEIRSKSLEMLDFIENRIELVNFSISGVVDDLEANISQEQIALFEELGDEFRRWVKENNPEIVDAVMRLTPAASFIGLMSLAGANMVWATPVVLALCGGKKIVDLVKGIKASE